MGAPFLVIMAGGSGTRFWPKSTSKRPKQLLSFGSSRSLLAQTFARFEKISPPERRWVVTTESLGEAVHAETPKGGRVLSEPQGRNTAPCIYWAAREIALIDPKAVMMLMPADHWIPNLAAFESSVRAAVQWAETHDDLVTLGIRPSRPETGYGYLRTGSKIQGDCVKVDAFVEKPNLEKAKEFLASGKYLWNGGMFVWRVEVVLAAFDQWMPEMRREWDSAGGKVQAAYPKLTATSIDFGLMEKAKNVVTFSLDCGWDDLGSWTSLENLAEALGAKHETGVVSAGQCVSIDSKGNVVDVPDRLVALLGVENLVIVESGGSLLVAQKERAQDIRQIVERVKKVRPELA